MKEVMNSDLKNLEKAVHTMKKSRRQLKRQQIIRIQEEEAELESLICSSDELSELKSMGNNVLIEQSKEYAMNGYSPELTIEKFCSYTKTEGKLVNHKNSIRPSKEMPSPIPKDTSEDLIRLENQLLNITEMESEQVLLEHKMPVREVLRDITLEEMNTSRLGPSITFDSVHESDKKVYNAAGIKVEYGNPIEPNQSFEKENANPPALCGNKGDKLKSKWMSRLNKKGVVKTVNGSYEKNVEVGKAAMPRGEANNEVKQIALKRIKTTSSIPRAFKVKTVLPC
eukprot:TRINITY_DN11433_c0_g1_i1.p1 TRINITY_DN11433_c0_g1~~TRINITY_DN11433_c0_g1_i1.p1  ORF type:complete len:283 (+),score=60.99 TRINITY_DN11433_c0_g1_i1:129-977(+)